MKAEFFERDPYVQALQAENARLREAIRNAFTKLKTPDMGGKHVVRAREILEGALSRGEVKP